MQNETNCLQPKPKAVTRASPSSFPLQTKNAPAPVPLVNKSASTYTQPASNIGAQNFNDKDYTNYEYLTRLSNSYYLSNPAAYAMGIPTANYGNGSTQNDWFTNYASTWVAPHQATNSQSAFPSSTKNVNDTTSSVFPIKVPSKNPKKTSNDTSVFDENSELKERIRELEAQLSFESMKGSDRKILNDASRGSNAQLDNCTSSTPTKKKDPEHLLKIDTPIKDLNQHDRKWIQRYEEVMAYQLTHGHNMVPAGCKPLGPWVCRQRQEKKKGMLSKEREALLNEIDFVWIAK